jgi:antitoxin (DNA-binding transcriptional repressor) of toxin-antitoxin stability system
MKTITQNEVKANIFKILEMVKNGEDILIKGEDSKENLAVIIPYKKYKVKVDRQLGILKGKASYKLKEDFKITEEELLSI